MTNQNEVPTITSNGGGDTAAASIAENTTVVTTVTATDPDAGQTLSYAIVGGADAAKFTINATTGALAFATAPNFEAPTDSGANNVYDVERAGLGRQRRESTLKPSRSRFRMSPDATINGTNLAETLTGTGEEDIINGLGGNDTLNGAAGADTMVGGLGNDTYVVDNTGDVVTENSNEGTDTVQAAVTYSLALRQCREPDPDWITGSITGTGNSLGNVLTGNSGANVLTGLAGDDTLNGGAGADTMLGGLGNDTYVVDNAGDVVTENANEGTDTVQAGVTYTLATNVENLTLTGTGSINGTGNALDNVIVGNSGNNVLAGLGGADTLDGGTGTDTASYAASSSGVTVSLATGTGSGGDAQGDTLISIENLTGSGLNDTLEGNGANNVLNGGAGTDTVSYEHAGAAVTVSLAITAAQNTGGAGTDTLSLFENLTGSAFNDVLTGSTAANVLMGLAGNDTLNGGAGADTMSGGLGNDTYVVDNTGDVVTENANEGTDTVQAGVTYTLATNVENLTLTGTGSINGTGNALDNVIVGNSGNNVLAGLGGADTLDGGTGTDTASYAASSSGVTVSLATGTGSGGDAQGDTLISIENLTGSGLNDTLEGNGANNVLNGGAGTDTVSYEHAGAAVTVSLAITAAQNTGGAGTDTLSLFENLTGSAFNDVLTGSTAANVLMGLAGNDTLVGGSGADLLTGGLGADRFVFSALADSVPGTPDLITDFVHGTDIIDFSGIDANTSSSGNQAFAFGGQNANVVANSVTWFENGGNTFIQADVNGNTTADFMITLTGTNHNLSASDFIL